MMYSPYLKMAMGKKRLPDWEAVNGRLPEDVQTALLESSPTTIDRLLKPHQIPLPTALHGKTAHETFFAAA